MELRPNQVAPVQIGVEFFRLPTKEAKPSIIVAPTAFGKSVVIAKIVKEVDDKILVLQPTKELLEQNYLKYMAITRDDEFQMGERAAIYSASFGKKQLGKVTFATIGSIKSIGTTFRQLGFTKMIIDEAHLYPREADSMLGRFLESSGITHVLGLTATPLKLQTNVDLKGNSFSVLKMLTSRSKKGNFFKEVLYVSQIKEMVELKFWSKLEYLQYDLDESGLVYNSTKAEFTEESIKEVYKTNDVHGKVIAKIAELEDRKSILVFVPSVAEAVDLASRTPNSVAIYGDMDKKDRDFAVSNFKTGKIRTVFNVNVLSVGFDHPELDAIICARSTASLSWFYQALGRGTRIVVPEKTWNPGKKDCLIVDFSGNVRRFGRLEEFWFVKEDQSWKLYGEGKKLLSGIPLHEIGHHTQETENAPKVVKFKYGKYKDQPVSSTPSSYRQWVLENFDWSDSRNKELHKELLRLKELESKPQAQTV